MQLKNQSRRVSAVRRFIPPLYGSLCYGFFLATFLYAIGFTTNLVVPTSVDVGTMSPPISAVLIDVALLAVFAVQHSLMAREGFKRRWTRIIPKAIERSTYVLFASCALALLFWQWRPLPDLVWALRDPSAQMVAALLAATGWCTVLCSTFLISHAELFGLRQVFTATRDGAAPQLRTPGLYKLVRHPIYLGFVIAFSSTAVMTVGHLLFAIATTGYILMGILFEERDLVRLFGEPYVRYRRDIPMLVPLWKLGRRRSRDKIA
jgi:methanethiol S-methyltransferase